MCLGVETGMAIVVLGAEGAVKITFWTVGCGVTGGADFGTTVFSVTGVSIIASTTSSFGLSLRTEIEGFAGKSVSGRGWGAEVGVV